MIIANCKFISNAPFFSSFYFSATHCSRFHILMTCSSQFDPAPRDDNWHKSTRTPDYFL